MRRVPEVLDCWFESGSMPFAQVHYPFENKEWFESHFPADFIVEYVAQTRGWFYTLVVLATALFDKPPFKNVICHGVVLDSEGAKLSKSLRNYPDPEEMFETVGSDALRWFLMSSPILRGGDLAISKDGKQMHEVVRLVLNPIWNAYYFFTLYANTDGVKADLRFDQEAVLDRYALGKTRQMVESVQQRMDGYDLAGTCQDVKEYLDALNNWYIRRSRPRFWGESGDEDRQSAYDTLYTCLITLCQAVAPLLPLLAEEVYTGLTGEESVHLSDWPDVSKLPVDAELVAGMDRVREICSIGLALREAKKRRTRLPLPKVTLAGVPGTESIMQFRSLVEDELNVKKVDYAVGIDDFIDMRLSVDAKALGPRLGAKMKDVLAATRTNTWKVQGDRAEIAGVVLTGGEFQYQLVPKDGFDAAALSTQDMVVVLDTEVTPELEQEGIARDFVRLVQQARKDAGLHVSDRIELFVDAAGEVRGALEAHHAYIAEQVLTEKVQFAAAPPKAFAAVGKVGSGSGTQVQLAVAKI